MKKEIIKSTKKNNYLRGQVSAQLLSKHFPSEVSLCGHFRFHKAKDTSTHSQSSSHHPVYYIDFFPHLLSF